MQLTLEFKYVKEIKIKQIKWSKFYGFSWKCVVLSDFSHTVSGMLSKRRWVLKKFYECFVGSLLIKNSHNNRAFILQIKWKYFRRQNRYKNRTVKYDKQSLNRHFPIYQNAYIYTTITKLSISCVRCAFILSHDQIHTSNIQIIVSKKINT